MRTDVARFPLEHELPGRSTDGRVIYALGDVHGRYDLLTALLERIVDDLVAQPDGAVPLLIFCGGYIDHGPASAEVLATLVWLSRHAPAEVRVLQGSHERALLNFLDDPETLSRWLALGGDATLRAFGVDVPEAGDVPLQDRVAIRDALSDQVPASQLDLLRAAPAQTSCGDYAFAHAVFSCGEKVLVHGNGDGSATLQLTRGRVGIDTAAADSDVLTALRIAGASIECLQTCGDLDPPATIEPPPATSEVITMRDALARLRPGY